MILPAPIDLVAPALVADVGGEAHAAVRILVRGGGVNRAGTVNHHIAGFVIGDKPAHVETLGVSGWPRPQASLPHASV